MAPRMKDPATYTYGEYTWPLQWPSPIACDYCRRRTTPCMQSYIARPCQACKQLKKKCSLARAGPGQKSIPASIKAEYIVFVRNRFALYEDGAGIEEMEGEDEMEGEEEGDDEEDNNNDQLLDVNNGGNSSGGNRNFSGDDDEEGQVVGEGNAGSAQDREETDGSNSQIDEALVRSQLSPPGDIEMAFSPPLGGVPSSPPAVDDTELGLGSPRGSSEGAREGRVPVEARTSASSSTSSYEEQRLDLRSMISDVLSEHLSSMTFHHNSLDLLRERMETMYGRWDERLERIQVMLEIALEESSSES
ncbi:hypothetical protein EIP91_004528 [Steccherinum ochraceum]|uniref:Zn(2)-C6 fungal-type domain-containing protein n=1 Tax=Steccherinum ochraceum TaxID=92696 RepID=A0A4R0RET9_9APHY|nr:hypothetical protein EIP91_004528 [Steccherinum ochraceum]